tara:strand:- start:1079 stop:1339 length:261 start_codon:yes stop_codon:yes gene_type:complete
MKDEEISELKNETNSIQIEISHIKKDLCEINKMLKLVDHAIRGNGKIGLSQRVTLIEAQHKNRIQFLTMLASLSAAAAAIISVFVK